MCDVCDVCGMCGMCDVVNEGPFNNVVVFTEGTVGNGSAVNLK